MKKENPTNSGSYRVNRRNFLKSIGVLGGAVAVSPALLAACSSDDSSSANSVHISNWTAYIADALKSDFERETGISLTYTEDISDNIEYFAKIQPVLSRNNSIDRDGIVLTDWMCSRLINQLEWTQPLDKDVFTNFSNLQPALADPAFDPGREQSVPWASGIAGIAYNISLTGGEIRTYEEFLAVEGRTTVLTEMRDTLGIVMMADGVNIETVTRAQLDAGFDALQEAFDSGQINGANGNEYVTDLEGGNIAACFAWSGDVAQASVDNPDIRFVVPESGGTLWSDNFMIPISSDKPDLATEFINYFYDPAVSAKWVEFVQFISPVVGVEDELTKLGGEAAALVDNPLVVPTEEILSNLQIFGPLSEEDEEAFDQRTAEVLGAG